MHFRQGATISDTIFVVKSFIWFIFFTQSYMYIIYVGGVVGALAGVCLRGVCKCEAEDIPILGPAVLDCASELLDQKYAQSPYRTISQAQPEVWWILGQGVKRPTRVADLDKESLVSLHGIAHFNRSKVPRGVRITHHVHQDFFDGQLKLIECGVIKGGRFGSAPDKVYERMEGAYLSRKFKPIELAMH